MRRLLLRNMHVSEPGTAQNSINKTSIRCPMTPLGATMWKCNINGKLAQIMQQHTYDKANSAVIISRKMDG